MCEIVKAINYTAFDSEWNCSSFSPKKKKKKKKERKGNCSLLKKLMKAIMIII